MSLTRTRFIQSNTVLAKIDDPITAINSGSTVANVDVGFIFNRNIGIKSNAAVYWNEAGEEFRLALTSDSGTARANITLTSYANIRANTIFANIGGGPTTSNTFITGHFLPSANVTYDLGTSSKRFRDLWLSGSTIYMGSESLSVNAEGEWVFTNGSNVTKIGGSSIFKDMTVTGNLTVQGNSFISDTINTTVYDSMIDLHTYGNLDPLLSDDGRDVGIKLHYYKTQNSVGFLGWKNSTGNLEWYADGTEGVGNVFTGTYGTIKTGELILANTTAATNTSSGALQVAGGASVAGALFITNTGDVSANIGTLFLGNISTNANLGAYQLYANANAAAQTIAIDSLALGANANTAAYLLTATGNISAGNVSAGNITTSGNIYTQRVYSEGVFWAGNGQPFGSVTTAGQDGDLQYKSGSTLAAASIRQDAGNGNLVITTGTQSTSTDTGALVVKGGLGVNGNIFASGLNGQLYGTLYLGTTAVSYNRSSGDQSLTGITIDGTAGTAEVAVASEITSNISSGIGYLTFVDKTTGNAALNIGPSLQYNPSSGRLSAYALTVTTGNVLIEAGTDSTSNVTGALVVNGGLGVTGNIWAQSNIYSAGSRVLTARDLETITFTANYISKDPANVAVPVVGTGTIYGTHNFGNLEAISTYGDYNTTAESGYYSVNDASGAPGFIVYVGFTGISSFNRAVYNINYTQQSGHTITIDFYNYDTDAWNPFATYSGLGNWQAFALGVIDANPYIDAAGNVTTRIYHVSSGNVSHRTWIDYVALEQSVTGGQGPRGVTGATGPSGTYTGGYVSGVTTFGSNLVANSGTASSSTTTGALVVVGGAGISGSLNINNTGDVSANIGSIYNQLNTLDANVGAFETYSNANAAVQSIAIDSLASGANTNTAAFLTTYTGNIQAGNINVISNLVVGTGSSGNITGVNYLVASNIIVNANIDMTSGYITNVADPLAAQDAATKNYVDSQISGFSTTTISAGSAYVTVVDDGGFGNVEVAGNLMVDVIRFANGAPWSTGISGITVSEINTANALSNISTGVTSIRFDRDTGMYVNELSPGNVRVSLGSTFKTWHVPGQADLVAIAEDEVTFFGNGIDITTNPVFPKAITFIANNSVLEANIGAYQLYANANIGTLYLGNISTQANIGSIYNQLNLLDANVGAFELYANANIGSIYNHVNTLDANVGAFELYANANIGSIYNHVNTLDANVGAFELYANANIGTLYLGNISTQANLGAFQAYANATFATGGSTSELSANLGAYQLYANANVGSIYNQLNALDANVGAFELYANANIGSIYNHVNTLDANIGSYQLYSNANAAAQAVSLDTINANIGAFYTYANSKIGTNNNSNLVIASTDDTVSATTGALVVAGGVGIGGNLYVAGNIFASNLISINSTTLTVQDPLLYLNADNPSPYNYDIGFYSHFVGGSPSHYQHTGIARDYATGIWGIFSNVRTEPGSTIDWSNVEIMYDTVRLGELIVANTTPSTSTTTGALRVAGGAGIAGELYIANTGDVSANIGTLYLGNISTQANLGAYQLYANANLGTQETSINSINYLRLAFNTYANANIGTLFLGNISTNANLGAFQIYANANIGTLFLGNASTNANLGAYQLYANANLGTATTNISSLQANLGAYQLYANANLGTATTNISSLQANLGAYQLYANANLGTATTNISALQANLGAYQLYANANIGTLFLGNASINANLGAFQTYANATFGTTYSNANVVANLQNFVTTINSTANIITSANIYASNIITTGVTGNISGVSYIFATNYVYPNGVSILDGIGGTYSNANVTAYLPTYTGNISGGNVILTSNIYASNYYYTNGVSILTGIGGTYSNANVAAYLPTYGGNISAGNIVAYGLTTGGTTGNISGVSYIFATNYVYPNGVSILDGITGGSGTYSNVNVEAYLGANLTSYYVYANANAATQATSIRTLDANIGVLYLGNISTQANLGAFQTYANATFGATSYTNNNVIANLQNFVTTINSTANIITTANVIASRFLFSNGASILNFAPGTYSNVNVEAYFGANIGSLLVNAAAQAVSINTINANLGAFQTYANANIGTLFLGNASTNANLGAFQTYANANIGTLFLGNASTNANLGAFQTYANSKIGSNPGGNVVIASANTSVSTTTGALVVAGGAGIAGNVYTDKLFTTTGIFWAGNGAPWMAQFTASDSAPPLPSLGSYWYKTTTDVVYEYVNDGTNSFWLDIVTPPYAANIVTSTYIGDTYAGNITFTGTITGSVGYLLERANIVASAPPAVTNLDLITSPIAYFTSNSTQNITANIRGNANTPLNSMMSVGQSATFVIFMPNATAYYINAIKIDNVTVTPFWQGGSSVINGNANSLDVYTFAVLKTANATFKIFASQVRYQNLGP